MSSHSSSTADGISEVSVEIAKAVQLAAENLSGERAERVRSIVAKIKSLEKRGFLRRQQFSAPTASDFERQFAHVSGENQLANR